MQAMTATDMASVKALISNANQPRIANTMSSSLYESKATVEEAAKEFEAIVIKQFIQQMFENQEPNPLTGGGHAEETFRELLHEEYANSISNNGGLGMSQQIKAELIALQGVQ